MRNKILIFVFTYLLALILANLVVKHFGAEGLWFTAFFLIPFDFVSRCFFHETWKGLDLIFKLILLTFISGLITIGINFDAVNIALGSFIGIIAAQLGAGIFYQLNIKKGYFLKVNGSDIIAITLDSIFFQLVAFSLIEWRVTLGQIIVKFLGGLMWYFILFKWLKVIK